MILSIVIPTLGRVSEVRELLKSIELSKIENLSFEIVIVDQNFSNLLDPIVREFTQKGFLILIIDFQKTRGLLILQLCMILHMNIFTQVFVGLSIAGKKNVQL